MAVLQNTLIIITSPQRDEITKVYKIFRGRVCHGRGEKREGHSEILMSYRQVGIAADYELNSLSARVLSLSLSFPPSSVSFTLLHNSPRSMASGRLAGHFRRPFIRTSLSPNGLLLFRSATLSGYSFPLEYSPESTRRITK